MRRLGLHVTVGFLLLGLAAPAVQACGDRPAEPDGCCPVMAAMETATPGCHSPEPVADCCALTPAEPLTATLQDRGEPGVTFSPALIGSRPTIQGAAPGGGDGLDHPPPRPVGERLALLVLLRL